jgi:ketosteroid isomerase-like protein
MRAFSLLSVTLLSLAVSAAAQSHPGRAREVFAAESAFAQSMAARNLAAFGTFVAYDAVFFGRRGPLRGKGAVVAGWQSFFEGPDAPFSWTPETVEVLASGTLAHSSGPVRDPSGRQIGTFNSIWRREADGRWRVVFDKGCSCEAAEAATPAADSLAIVAASRAFGGTGNDTAARGGLRRLRRPAGARPRRARARRDPAVLRLGAAAPTAGPRDALHQPGGARRSRRGRRDLDQHAQQGEDPRSRARSATSWSGARA